MPDFIPRSEPQLAMWLLNHQQQITVLGASLGLSGADITAITNACTRTITNINAVEAKKNELDQTITNKDTQKDEDLGTIRNYVRIEKANPGFTDAIGAALGIMATASAMDEENMKSKLTAEAFPGYVRLKFTKKGLDGVNIYTRLKGQSAWNFLARDTNSPYDDNRALTTAGVPETREYMCIGVVADGEIGQPSDIVSVVFGG